ncbi:MAG: aminoacetone oxidase family FAD-binding enzyme, partial [bacterium]
ALSEPLTGLIHSRLITYCRKEKLDPVAFLKNWTLRVTGLKGASDAQVMRGGVMLNSLDHRFQSKKLKHLYVIGEILNLTGDCGGYNIHFALASASYLAEHIYDE